jgi:hypothetical protein
MHPKTFPAADPAARPGLDRITLPRRAAGAVRIDARLVDEIGWSTPGDGAAAMRLRLWQGRSKLAVEVVVTADGATVLDAATASGIDGIAEWLEALDPWSPDEGPGSSGLGHGPQGLAQALLDEAMRAQWRVDFRALVGEALFRWYGVGAPGPAAMETAA